MQPSKGEAKNSDDYKLNCYEEYLKHIKDFCTPANAHRLIIKEWITDEYSKGLHFNDVFRAWDVQKAWKKNARLRRAACE